MVAYEFLTEITASRTLPIPAMTAPSLPIGAQVRVILLVEEDSSQNGAAKTAETHFAALQQIVAEIQRSPKSPNLPWSDSGLLGQHLAELETEVDPTFDVESWLQEWDQIEAAIKQESLDREMRLLQDVRHDALFA